MREHNNRQGYGNSNAYQGIYNYNATDVNNGYNYGAPPQNDYYNLCCNNYYTYHQRQNNNNTNLYNGN